MHVKINSVSTGLVTFFAEKSRLALSFLQNKVYLVALIAFAALTTVIACRYLKSRRKDQGKKTELDGNRVKNPPKVKRSEIEEDRSNKNNELKNDRLTGQTPIDRNRNEKETSTDNEKRTERQRLPKPINDDRDSLEKDVDKNQPKKQNPHDQLKSQSERNPPDRQNLKTSVNHQDRKVQGEKLGEEQIFSDDEDEDGLQREGQLINIENPEYPLACPRIDNADFVVTLLKVGPYTEPQVMSNQTIYPVVKVEQFAVPLLKKGQSTENLVFNQAMNLFGQPQIKMDQFPVSLLKDHQAAEPQSMSGQPVNPFIKGEPFAIRLLQDGQNNGQVVVMDQQVYPLAKAESSQSWFTTLGNGGFYIYDCAKSAGAAAYSIIKSVAGANSRAKKIKAEILQGIDLEPLLVVTYGKGKDGVNGGMNAVTDFWNAPSAEYSPVTANIMQGFGKEFGSHLHYLLLNSANLGGPELAGALADHLNILNKINPLNGGHQLLQISNPLGWGSLMINLMHMGISIQDVVEESLMTRLEEKIEKLVFDLGLKAGFKKEHILYMQKHAALQKAEKIYKDQLKVFLEHLQEEPIDPIHFASADWHVKFEEAFATKEYLSAKQNLKVALENLEADMQEPISASIRLQWIPFTDLTTFLMNTTKKTLGHLVEDVEASTPSLPFVSESMNNKMKKGMKNFVLGGQLKPIKPPAKILFGKALKIMKEFNKFCADPTSAAKKSIDQISTFIPQVSDGMGLELIGQKNMDIMRQEFHTLKKKGELCTNSFLSPINQGIGHFAGQTVIASMSQEAIGFLQLENLNLFKEEQLQFPIIQRIQEAEYISSDLKEALGLLLEDDIFGFNLDAQLQSLIQEAGKEAAKMFSLALAKRLEGMLAEKGVKCKAEDLMSKEIEISLFAKMGGKAINKGVKGLTWAVKGAANLFKAS